MQISVENGHTMILTRNIIFLLFFCVTNIRAHSLPDLESNDLNNNLRDDHGVYVQVYYNSLGRDSRVFYILDLFPVLTRLRRSGADISYQTYPFGNTKVIEDNGNVSFECPHGPDECYGNKLHACALHSFGTNMGLQFNNCLMNIYDKNSDGSDDEAVDRCGQEMNIATAYEIKDCAKSTRGTELLLYYGELSKEANFSYVPHVLINGQMYNIEDNFFEEVCAAFDVKPPVCPVINLS